MSRGRHATMGPLMRLRTLFGAFQIAAFAVLGGGPLSAAELDLRPGDRVVFVGNTLAERLQLFGHFETRFAAAHADLGLTFRNLAWSADEIHLRPRPLDFGDLESHLAEQEADVALLFFGANESTAGPAALPDFERDLERFVRQLASRPGSDGRSLQCVLVSPIPQERRGLLPDPAPRNAQISAYADAMRRVAEATGVPFVDLYRPMLREMEQRQAPLTVNGVHLGDLGYRLLAGILEEALGAPTGELTMDVQQLEEVRRLVVAKNRLFFDRYRAVNGYYIYGGRKEPFGVVNFPAEMERFDELVAERDGEIAKRLQESGR